MLEEGVAAQSLTDRILSSQSEKNLNIDGLWNRCYAKFSSSAAQAFSLACPTLSKNLDIATSVMLSLCRHVSPCALSAQSTNMDLMRLLMIVAHCKTAPNFHGARTPPPTAGHDTPKMEWSLLPFSGADIPASVILSCLYQQYDDLMQRLSGSQLRSIAEFRMMGHSIHEIADRLGLTQNAVEADVQSIALVLAQQLD